MNDKNEEVIDIIDSFGRSKTIPINSREYDAYEENIEIEKAKRKLHDKNGQQNGNNYNKNLEFDPSSDNKPDKFAWSNGQTHSESGEWLKDLVTERGIKALVEQKVEREIELSIGAKVKTMYEKTLSSSAKTYLKEVHDESVMRRTLHQEKASVTSSRLDDRREMLRLKKLQQQNK